MMFWTKLFQKWILAQLLQLVLIQNIYANTNDMFSWLVAIKVKNSLAWSYGSLITDRAVLTSAKVVANVQEEDLTVIKDCEIMILQISNLELCHEQNVVNIHLIRDSDTDDEFQNNVAILILYSPFEQITLMKIVDRFDDFDQNNCFFINWDFFEVKDSMTENTITSLYRVSFVNKTSNISELIQNRIKNPDMEYAISNTTSNLLQTQDGYKMALDVSKDYLGNPLFCSLKKNSSTYVQIGIAEGYLTLQRSDDSQLMVGRYYVDVMGYCSQIINLISERRTFPSLFSLTAFWKPFKYYLTGFLTKF